MPSPLERPQPSPPARLRAGRGQRGSILPVVIILSLVGAMVIGSLMSRALSSVRLTSDTVRRNRAYYATDGITRIAMQEIQSYMMQNPDPATSDLQNTSNVPVPQIPGYSVEQFVIRSLGAAYDGPVPNGAFTGMNAHQKPVSLSISAREDTSRAAARIDAVVLLGQISLFQFFVFGAGYLDLFPGPDMTIRPGRVHANGDLCIGSTNTLRIETVTSAARLLAGDNRCRRNVSGATASIWNGSAYVSMSASNSSGCTSCGGTTQDWETYAISTWQGNARDSAQGVPFLKLPISTAPQTQAGLNASGATVSNAETTRILVDPVQSTDTSDVQAQRFAAKADLRIINGVWYRNDGTWPGQPIWSDHPGAFTTRNEEGIEGSAQQVGQADLRTRYAWSTTPRRYSFYEYNPTTQVLTGDSTGVVSYGSLVPTSDGERPGFWVAGANGATFTDVDGYSKLDFCNTCSGTSPCNAAVGLRAAATGFCQVSVGGGLTNLIDAQYLQATTSGFMDYRVRNTTTSAGPILPMNLDLTQLAAAMQDETAGELGSYFNGGRSFNGVIYVSSTWTGSMSGMPGGQASLWPAQGAVTDTSQSAVRATPQAQRALPYNLCSDSLGYVPSVRRTGFSLPASDGLAGNGFEPVFTVPSCDPTVSPTGRVSALRLINGATINRAVFPDGLSIVTNLPIYLQGNMNTGSITTSETATPWVPFLVGADAISLLSSNWRDVNAPWDNSGSWASRNAASTTYNFEGLGGNVETVDNDHYSGGVENFPRFLENWTGQTSTIAGAFVVGYASVYQRQPWHGGNPVYDAPVRNWYFDTHLKSMMLQPPGSPLFSIYSMTYLEESALVTQ